MHFNQLALLKNDSIDMQEMKNIKEEFLKAYRSTDKAGVFFCVLFNSLYGCYKMYFSGFPQIICSTQRPDFATANNFIQLQENL